MKKKVIEIISPFGKLEPIHRMKILGLIHASSQKFSFCEFDSSEDEVEIVLINCLHLDLIKNSAFIEKLEKRSKTAVVMLMMADFYPSSIEYLKLWEKFVDTFLVPTPEMLEFVKIFTYRPVRILIDPIDFSLTHSRDIEPTSSLPLKVVWFGYPESYAKSMAIYEDCMAELHKQRKIEFHIISRNKEYGAFPGGIMHEYHPNTFLELLEQFDVAVLSHQPFDFTIGTLWKSENKAILAINRGLPVIASRTPAYQRLLTSCKQDEFLFSTFDDLKNALKKMENAEVRKNYLRATQRIILDTYSVYKMSDQFIDIYHEFIG